MVKRKTDFCTNCLNTGQCWNGSEMEECFSCDGQDHSEDLDDIIDLDDDTTSDDINYDSLDEF